LSQYTSLFISFFNSKKNPPEKKAKNLRNGKFSPKVIKLKRQFSLLQILKPSKIVEWFTRKIFLVAKQKMLVFKDSIFLKSSWIIKNTKFKLNKKFLGE